MPRPLRITATGDPAFGELLIDAAGDPYLRMVLVGMQRSPMYLGSTPLTASASNLGPPLRALCPQEVLHESPYDRGHGESMFGAPRFERSVRFLWQSNGERLMLAARWNDRQRRCHQL